VNKVYNFLFGRQISVSFQRSCDLNHDRLLVPVGGNWYLVVMGVHIVKRGREPIVYVQLFGIPFIGCSIDSVKLNFSLGQLRLVIECPVQHVEKWLEDTALMTELFICNYKERIFVSFPCVELSL
jgi:hypothetical protein